MGLSSEANYYKNNFNVNLNPPKLFYSNSNQTNKPTAHSLSTGVFVSNELDSSVVVYIFLCSVPGFRT